MPYDEGQDAGRREEPRQQPDREASDDRGAPVRDDEHDGGFGDGPLM